MVTNGKEIDRYQKAYIADYGFESEMVRARQRMVRLWLEDLEPSSVVEIGCGQDMLFSQVASLDFVQRWIIVEASEVFAANATEALSREGRVTVINKFAETAVEEVLSMTGGGTAAVICSGLLHEVLEPFALLEAALAMARPGAGLHVNVPNAGSLHRQLAKAMGLISGESELSERNRLLQQSRVYDATSLSYIVKEVGFEIEDTGGYFLKPFTHRQMSAILPKLPKQVLDGLWSLGRENPNMASEIFVNARIPVES